MNGSEEVERYMERVSDALDRHVEKSSAAWTDIYNRCFEAVDRALRESKP